MLSLLHEEAAPLALGLLCALFLKEFLLYILTMPLEEDIEL